MEAFVNTVSSKDQLKDGKYVKFHHSSNRGLKIMFVGNSITLHGKAPHIGWNFEHGMAASSIEKDYVHLTENAILEKHPDASFCICQVAEWERNYKKGYEILPQYQTARDFDADVIILRYSENCPTVEFDIDTYVKESEKLLSYLNKSGKAKTIVTTSFWRRSTDEGVIAFAKKDKLPLVFLGDLGDNIEMRADGLFEHEGVAGHPGDEGMKEISNRIVSGLLEHKII